MAELDFDIAVPRGDGLLSFKGAIPLEGVTAIMGPSGSGKTTLLMALAGLERRMRGEIRFDGRPWAWGRRGLKPEARRIGYVFQDGRLFSHLSVAANLAFGARRRGVPIPAIQGVAEGMGLQDLMDRRPATLSGGETRRVAVARALASGPDILFMDEPLSGLDDEAKAQVLPYLAQAVAGSGVPVVYVTHSRAEVTQFADRVLLVAEGRIAGWGPPPLSLAVTVARAGPGWVEAQLGDARMRLPGFGRPGDARRIALAPDSVLLSRDAPGPSGALVTLRARVLGARALSSEINLRLRVAEQSLTWRIDPGAPLNAPLPAEGEWIWISILAASLR
ncbi:MAG: ATP-binding cassette domain-containing protein [Pseudomonadota bacterium]